MVKTIISDRTYFIAQKELRKLKVEGTLFKKLQAVKLAYEHGIKETSEFLGVFPVSIRNWAKLINQDDLSSLKIGSKHKDGIKLKNHHKEQIEKWIKMNPNITRQSVIQKLKDKFDLEISLSTARRAMKSVGFSYITPRKNHYRQDKKEVSKFKKNLQHEIKKDEELWFFDESRFGTHSKIGRGWFKTGIRTPIKIKLGYKNFYLYSIANPKTGEEFTLLLPNVNIKCMNIFLNEFSKFIKNRKTLIVMDGAGWHKSDKLRFPKILES